MKQKCNLSDIVFVEEPVKIISRKHPLALLSLSAYLREHGYDNTVITPYSVLKKRQLLHEPTPKTMSYIKRAMVNKIVKLQPKVIALSTFTADFLTAMDFIEAVKKRIDVIAVVGGHHANVRPQDFFKHNIDFVSVGEGEITLRELIDAIFSGKKDFSHIDGLVWKKKGKLVYNKPRALMPTLDHLPVPAYDKIDLEPYLEMWDGQVRGVPLRCPIIFTGRGCPYACTFCSCNKVFGRTIRYTSLENIEKEVKYLKEKYDIEGINLVDDLFVINKERMFAVAKIFHKHNLVWSAQARVNLVDEEIVKTLRKYGCVQLEFGVESGSQRILDEIINKQITIEQIKKAFALCKKHNMRAHANIIVGFPTETYEEMMKTINLAKEIKPDFCALSIATPLPGTKLEEMVGGVDPEDYFRMEFLGNTYINKYNKSKVPDLNEVKKFFFKELKKINFKGWYINIPFYIQM